MGKYATFGERLKKLRIDNGFKSQKEFADKIGMAYQTINYYESGKRKPDIDYFKKFADFFGVSYDYLLGESNCKNRENIDISNELGLSEKAINNLKELVGYTHSDSFFGESTPLELIILNELLSDTKFIGYSADASHKSILNYIAMYTSENHLKETVMANIDKVKDNELLNKLVIDEILTKDLSQLETITAVIQYYYKDFIKKFAQKYNSIKFGNASSSISYYAIKYRNISDTLYKLSGEVTDYVTIKENGDWGFNDNGEV